MKEWERKSERKQLRDFIEYLGYFHELGGDIAIEEQPFDDAVQLMTVHGAKGLEFPHVYILRLSKNDFPSSQRRPKFEFPAGADERGTAEGSFPCAGGAAAFLCGANAREAAPDACHDRQPAEEGVTVLG